MTLKVATITWGLFFSILGVLWLMRVSSWEIFLKSIARSPFMNYVFFGSALVWFMLEISQLGPADFGPYRPLLFIVFGGAGLLSFYFIPDFLAIRGLAGLGLLSAQPLLMSAYCEPYLSRLWLVGGVYVMIIGSMLLGTYPYLYRDIIHKLYERPLWSSLLGGVSFSYGLLSIGCSFFY